jgi:exodeoxyribonuclease VII small subunit
VSTSDPSPSEAAGLAAGLDGTGPVPSGYAEAQAELDAILSDLERPDLDVDRLAARVRRAAVLITFCRERITSAKVQIEQVVAGLGTEHA